MLSAYWWGKIAFPDLLLPSMPPLQKHPILAEAPAFTPLSPYERLLGPVTQSKVVRLMLLYLMLAVVGAGFLAWSANDQVRIFGMGLIFPGGGFSAHPVICSATGVGRFAILLLAVGVFGISLVLWFATGNILAPPFTWLVLAVCGATMEQSGVPPGADTFVLAMAGGMLVCIALLSGAWFLASRRQRCLDNAYLAEKAHEGASIFTAPQLAPHAEMTLEHLQRLRFALDRALQPLSEFNGFERLDQFQTAAMRYQLNFLAYGVALTQARYTPAFGGYMHAAQIALLDKQRQHRVWKYWRLENLWGNMRSCPDPTAGENIMFTGFVALQMALFSASSGSDDFTRAGRFTLSHPNGQRYAHDASSLVGCMQRDFSQSDFYLIACEPNWVYPLCNLIGASAVLALDRSGWARHAPYFRHYLETEFLDGFGRYIPCRSARTGLAFPVIGGAMPLAMPCFFLNAIAPDLARRQWLLLRRKLFDTAGTFQRRAFWRVDTGNYGFSRASAYAATALAAAELGDEQVVEACMQAFEDECPSVLKNGVIHRRASSVWAHGVELMARASGRDAFKSLLTTRETSTGMRLEGLAYPDVLVASANVENDRLHAVMYAGNQEGMHTVGLAGLTPLASYRASGVYAEIFNADAAGNAQLTVKLAGRSVLTIERVN